jgi:hypothetical protein
MIPILISEYHIQADPNTTPSIPPKLLNLIASTFQIQYIPFIRPLDYGTIQTDNDIVIDAFLVHDSLQNLHFKPFLNAHYLQTWYNEPFPASFNPHETKHILLQATTSNVLNFNALLTKLNNYLQPHTDATIILHMEDPLFTTASIYKIIRTHSKIKHRNYFLIPAGYYPKHNLLQTSNSNKHNLQVYCSPQDNYNSYTITDSHNNHPYFQRRSIKQSSHSILVLGVRNATDDTKDWPTDTWTYQDFHLFQSSIKETMTPTPNQWYLPPIKLYSFSLKNPFIFIPHTSTLTIRTMAWFQLPSDYTAPILTQTQPEEDNTPFAITTQFRQCLHELQNSNLPFQVCPQSLLQLLTLLQCPSEEKAESAANIVLYIIHNFNKLLQVHQHLVNKYFARFRIATNNQLTNPTMTNLKKCLKCSNHVHAAVLIPWLQFRPQGLHILQTIYNKKQKLQQHELLEYELHSIHHSITTAHQHLLWNQLQSKPTLLCLGCAAETLYYSSNSDNNTTVTLQPNTLTNNNTRQPLRTNTHTYISTLGEQLFHQYYVTSKSYPLLSNIVLTNSYTHKDYRTLLIDHNVPFVSLNDDFDAYIARTLPVLSKWTRTTDADTTICNPVTIAHVLLTSSTSDDPSDCDYTVFFSNDNVLLAHTQRQNRTHNQQSKKKSKTSHENPNAGNMISSPIITQITMPLTTPDKPPRVTRQSTATLTPSSSSSKTALPPTKTTKRNSKSKITKSKQFTSKIQRSHREAISQMV